MVASLCGLRELIAHDPAAYRGLSHYFTNILKQAAEGRLGRAYEYHRCPAPFVQLELLRQRPDAHSQSQPSFVTH